MMSGTGAWGYGGSRGSSLGLFGGGGTYDMEQVREPGARRKKLAGYLKAANELRQTYQQSYMQGVGRDGSNDFSEPIPGAYPSAAVGRTGEEEMILFPSYARRRTKNKNDNAYKGSSQTPRGYPNQSDPTGVDDVDFWDQEYKRYDDENAIVDVDVRGWIYQPHSGPMNRKTRLFLGLARQMVGIPAPPGKSPSGSSQSSRSPSPHGLRERAEAKAASYEERIVAREAESIARKGEAEANIAELGGYSENPGAGDTGSDTQRRGSNRSLDTRQEPHGIHGDGLEPSSSRKDFDDSQITPVQKRESWVEPAQMSQEDLNKANSHLMRRVKPFLANPVVDTPISAFFYNEKESRQKTVDTNAYGHFSLRAALDFIPTHVRILANEYLSATQEVLITEPHGVSVISDIDDTIKHSGIGSGAREIFRNAFIREVRDLSIQGVKNWYRGMADLGCKFHYVSNSPWQLFPVLTAFFAAAGLPPGSFHLKQYNGMLQGVFEPVAERKKGTLEKLLYDFPRRRFILVGDSGEADLEVYTDLVMEYPGRILGIFIRDVTTTEKKEFFDTSVGSFGDGHSGNGRPTGDSRAPVGGGAASNRFKTYSSDRQMSTNSTRSVDDGRPPLPPRRQTAPPVEEEDLIDLNWEDDKPIKPPNLQRSSSDKDVTKSNPPPRPPKPKRLNSMSNSEQLPGADHGKRPPPRPSKPSSTVRTDISPVSTTDSQHQSRNVQNGGSVKPNTPSRPQVQHGRPSYRTAAREVVTSAYNHLPSPSSYLHSSHTDTGTNSTSSKANPPSKSVSLPAPSPDKGKPPAVPPRKPVLSYPEAAAQYATGLYNAATGSRSASPSSSSPSSQQQAPSSLLSQRPPVGPNRTNSYPYSTASFNSTGSASTSASYANTANKKEDVWKRRWARSKAILDERGIVLRSWRVGTDVEKEAVELVKRALKEGGEHEQGDLI